MILIKGKDNADARVHRPKLFLSKRENEPPMMHGYTYGSINGYTQSIH